MAKDTETGNAVQEYTIENTRVKICDDYCRHRTREEIDRILSCVAGRVYGYLYAPEAAGAEGEDAE